MVPNPSSLTPLFAIVARPVGEHIIKKVKSKINPSEIEQAIKAGLLAADQEDSQFPYEKHLFYNFTVDGLNGVKAFFGKYFEIEAVQKELAKPFNNEGTINIEYLTKEFEKIALNFSEVKPVEDRIQPWLNTFTKGYTKNLSSYLKLQVNKEKYFKQLSQCYDNINFAGIAVSGEDEVKDLQKIFVMPDVSEIESNQTTFTKDFKLTIDGVEQKLSSWEREKLDSQLVKSNSPFIAKKLLTETSNKKAILLGTPGSGKSTLVSYFAVMLAQGKAEELGLDNQVDWLPIVIEVRDVEKNLNLKIIDYIHQYAEKNLQLKELPKDFFEHWLNQHQALIMFDGIDEVADENKRYKVVEQLQLFLNQYPGNIALATSRPSGYKRDFFSSEEFPHYQLQPFDDNKIEQFIDNWYDSRVFDPEEANRSKDSLRKALQDNSRIKILAKNPLLLTMITLIHRYQAYLPKERHKLYDKAVETLLNSWDDKKAISRHKELKYLDLLDLRRLLESLAREIHSRNINTGAEAGTQIAKDDLLEWLTKYI